MRFYDCAKVCSKMLLLAMIYRIPQNYKQHFTKILENLLHFQRYDCVLAFFLNFHKEKMSIVTLNRDLKDSHLLFFNRDSTLRLTLFPCENWGKTQDRNRNVENVIGF